MKRLFRHVRAAAVWLSLLLCVATAGDWVGKAAGVRVTKVGFRAPNMNAYVERFVQAIQQECLDRFIIFGQEHFDLVCTEYLEHYHSERPHQAMGNAPLVAPASSPSPTEGKVICRERLGGVLRHYYREAA